MTGNRKYHGGSSSSSSASSPTKPHPRENHPLLPRSPSALSRSPSALLLPPAPPALHITIRFSTSLPDLHLDIPSPQQTTIVALKHLIRGRLAADADADADTEAQPEHDAPTQTNPASHASRARLRFIHNGRILPDASVLSAVLKAPPPPPLSHPDPKGKSVAGAPSRQQQRVFINCSIGDILTPADLADEATAAAAPPPPPPSSPLLSPSPTPFQSQQPPTRTPPPNLTLSTTNLPPSSSPNPPNTNPNSNTTTRPPPLGFDRLLSAGLTPAEVTQLRTHFRAIHTARFTPDTLPSPDTLRAMEDAWLDNSNNNNNNAQNASLSGYGSNVNEGEGEAAGMATEDAYGLAAVAGPLIEGMLIGFVFPLGVVGWLGKEEGVWSRRMHVFVVFGVLLSVTVGVVRGLTGEG